MFQCKDFCEKHISLGDGISCFFKVDKEFGYAFVSVYSNPVFRWSSQDIGVSCLDVYLEAHSNVCIFVVLYFHLYMICLCLNEVRDCNINALFRNGEGLCLLWFLCFFILWRFFWWHSVWFCIMIVVGIYENYSNFKIIWMFGSLSAPLGSGFVQKCVCQSARFFFSKFFLICSCIDRSTQGVSGRFGVIH